MSRFLCYILILIFFFLEERAGEFDALMGKGDTYYDTHYQQCLKNERCFSCAVIPHTSIDLLNLFRKLYEKNFLSIVASNKPKIPHIIHQIWLGSPFPERFKRYQKSWISLNPDWEYKLWTDSDIKKLALQNQYYFDTAKNFGDKTNILRYEILKEFGGVYADTDYECLKSFDELCYKYDFLCGICPLDEGFLYVNNALIASSKQHPIILECINTIPADKKCEDFLRKLTNTLNPATGPIHFTKSFFSIAGSCSGSVIALPPTYLCPLSLKQKHFDDNQKYALLRQHPLAYAIHHWSGENSRKTNL